jgi:AcrR family transcriptional regulator
MGDLSVRTQRRAETRQRILLAAREAFGVAGIAGTSTQDIARGAGVSHGSVFVHFGSREALIAAVVEEVVAGAADLVRQELKVARSPGGVLHVHLRALAEHEAVYARIVAERLSLPSEVQARLIELNSGVASYLLPALSAAGRLPVEPHFAFNAWLALVQYYLLNRDLFAPGRSVLTERAGELVRNYLAMIG